MLKKQVDDGDVKNIDVKENNVSKQKKARTKSKLQ